jgi:hypothetical protein
MTEQGMQQQNAQKNSALPSNLTVRLATLTHVFQGYAKRSQTKQDRHYIFALVESVGTAIAQEIHGVPGRGADVFSIEEWMTECGVDPQWGQLAA